MVLANNTLSNSDQSVYYKETSSITKSARFCLKNVQPGNGNKSGKDPDRRSDSINVQVVKAHSVVMLLAVKVWDGLS